MGQILDSASIEELCEWIEQLQAEIQRLEQTIIQKESDKAKADAIFK